MKNNPYKIEIKEVVDDYVVMNVYENEHKSYPTKRIVIKPYDLYMENDKLKEEIERLNNIIKEVREYIKSIDNYFLSDSCMKIIEILDKEK